MINSKFNMGRKIFLGIIPLSLAFTGCFGYRDVVDPYYPKRYNVDARNSVRTSMAPQVQNGNVLDQTVWDFHFEAGKPELNEMGKDHLKRLARRRPMAQEVIFLQVAQNPDERFAYDKFSEITEDDLKNLTNEQKTEITEDDLKNLTNEQKTEILELKKLNELKRQLKINDILDLIKIHRLTELKKLGVLKDEDLTKLKELVEKNKIKEINKIKMIKELNIARSENIKSYMNKISEGKAHPEFQVVLHDPAEVSGSGIEAARVITGKQSSVSGVFIPGQSGSSSGGTSSGQSGGGSGSSGGSSGTGNTGGY